MEIYNLKTIDDQISAIGKSIPIIENTLARCQAVGATGFIGEYKRLIPQLKAARENLICRKENWGEAKQTNDP